MALNRKHTHIEFTLLVVATYVDSRDNKILIKTKEKKKKKTIIFKNTHDQYRVHEKRINRTR